MTVRRTLGAGLTVGLLMVAAPAAAKGGDVDGEGERYRLTNGWAGDSDVTFAYGRGDDSVYAGDWDGSGFDTLAVRRGATYHFRNSLSGGAADVVATYGRSDDVVYMGDWDGDGVDTPVVRRGSEYHVKNSLTGGDADVVIAYGRPGDVVLIGDWDGDGVDTLGVRRGNVYHLKNSIAGGDADVVVGYGRAEDVVLVGNWSGQGGDTLGVRRGDVFHMKNSISGGNADIVMAYGQATDGVLVGDWDGDGSDTIGLRSPEVTSAAQTVDGMHAYDDRMIELVNAERAARGIAPVRAVPALRDAAVRHSTWMADQGRIEHAAWSTISSDAGAIGCTAASELIVRTWQRDTAPEPRAAIDWYMNSAVHRDAILNPDYRYLAAGSVEAGSYAYNTMRFARSCS
ncbi:CAP domain-containing protein [Georgenia sp. H159]|uniref:CAP domain-containing protein n=1 Tax=Georgenia sp. H159 TaxID=3076115 RepID=UPI002D7948BF|nr:CAP domain-containing protein [Georgenia sp. H159]